MITNLQEVFIRVHALKDGERLNETIDSAYCTYRALRMITVRLTLEGFDVISTQGCNMCCSHDPNREPHTISVYKLTEREIEEGIRPLTDEFSKNSVGYPETEFVPTRT